ncbi:MAG TPA: Ppx/GppA phosphatase family protein [Nitrospira sp.]|jgi:exopolyphosphatase / guanosine-5'-triphosphate,3'-diphosphate pyrophosphatase|nr:Ppx/GppA phosphatase family protein [Nitrospira sp.]
MKDQRLAGIDIGTLTCRLLIADVPANGSLKELHSERRILRLGEGVDQSKRLKAEAIDRVIRCVNDWRKIVEDYAVQRCSAVATSAVRDAANRQEFLDKVKSHTGLDVEILTGEEEARRTMLGIRSGLPQGITDVLALDIGGGSTEFIAAQQGQLPVVRSIDLGVVRLSERLLRHDPPTVGEIDQAREWIRRETRTASAGLPPSGGFTFVGTAGTITSLAAMAQQLPAYEPARIHNYRLALSTIARLEQHLLSRSKAALVGMPGLEKNREDVIAAGTIILRTVMETLGQPECLVSDLGLREGVLIELAGRLSQR